MSARAIEGDVVPCVYCLAGDVTLDLVEHDVEMQESDGKTVIGSFAEGDCNSCGRSVDYDYDPVAEPTAPGSRTGGH